MAIGALAAVAIPSIIQMIQGAIQGGRGRRMSEEYPRKDMPLPEGMLNAVEITKNLAMQNELPGQRTIEEKISESLAGSMQNIREGATSQGDIISGAQKLGEIGTEKIKDLGIAGAEFRNRNQYALANMMEHLSRLQEKKWMYDEYMPYLAAQDASRRYGEASSANLSQGLSNLSGIAANAIGMGLGGNKVGQARTNLDTLMKSIESQMKYTAPNF